MMIVVLSIGGIVLDELATSNFPMNPTIIRVMRVLRITRGKIVKIPCWEFRSFLNKNILYSSIYPSLLHELSLVYEHINAYSKILIKFYPNILSKHPSFFILSCFKSKLFRVVLKLLKTAEGIRSLLDTVGKALPQVNSLLQAIWNFHVSCKPFSNKSFYPF